MQVKDIITASQLDISMTTTIVAAVKHINEAMHMIALEYNEARATEEIEVEVTDNTVYQYLSDDMLAVRRVEKSTGAKFREGTRIRDKSILIPVKGTYNVVIEKLQEDVVSTETAIPAIDSAYHYALAKYISYKQRSRIFGKNDAGSQALKSDFWGMVESATMAIRRGQRKSKRIRAARY